MDIKELESDSLHKLIATRRVMHIPVESIMEELGITKAKLYKLIATPEYKAVLREISEEATGAAVVMWRASMANLIKESHRVLREKLADNDLKAVEIVLKSIGVDAVEQTQVATSINVVLPNLNGEQGKVFEVKSE